MQNQFKAILDFLRPPPPPPNDQSEEKQWKGLKWGRIVTCYISSRDEAEHHEDPHEHGANGGPDALSPPPPGTVTSPRALHHQLSFLVGPACTLRCLHNFSPPSAAHDTQPSETTVIAMLEQEVKSFDDFSHRKLPLQSSVTPKRQWKPTFQNRDSYPAL